MEATTPGALTIVVRMTAPSHPRIPYTGAEAIVAGLNAASLVTPDGEIESLSLSQAGARCIKAPPLVCHARQTARRLGIEVFPAFDLLELYAFVRPAAFCAPTPRGLALALGLPAPQDHDAQAALLREAADLLHAELAAAGEREAYAVAATMAQAGWFWGPSVLAALQAVKPERAPRAFQGYRVWERMGEWSEHAPEQPPGQEPVSATEARTRLAELLDEEAEARPEQADYASAVSQAFQPRARADEPNLVLAEAGTGVGKTLGYIAPSSVWSEKNQAPVWLSTYTRNLQHQIDNELSLLLPEPVEKSRKVVIRKGRENYLCLLNMEQALGAATGQAENTIALGLMARWAGRTRDGDMVGGDFPAWLIDLAGPAQTLALTDRRGECIYSACPHYRKCFIERGIRKARRASFVVANHALVMIQAAMGGGEEGALPQRYVFDEGHQLFDAADSAFSAHLSGQETAELRRWLLGAEASRRGTSRQRGLKRRIDELVADQPVAEAALEEVLAGARALPAPAWHTRLRDAAPAGPTESFLARVREQVYARADRVQDGYSLETPVHPLAEDLLPEADVLDDALERLQRPLRQLRKALMERLDKDAEDLDSETRRRIDATTRSIERRGLLPIQAWRDMLGALREETPQEYVDWFAVERIEGRDFDVGMFRHWIDPMKPFAETVLKPAQGAVVTSATLTDREADGSIDWLAAEMRSGALHLENEAFRARIRSPFDYARQTRVLIVTDLNRNDLDQNAAALRELFLASGGGGLGLFTAISRLRAAHKRIAPSLENAGLDLYAQHVDRLNTSTLVDIFRAEPDSCLLGTDAVRDGVDVPGRALRLIVFDRVPWPRPSLAHKARRQYFGGARYDDMLTRLRLRQAFGRLIRKADDRGVFVLLDSRMPTRLTTAFPEEVEVERIGLAEAVAATRGFLQPTPR